MATIKVVLRKRRKLKDGRYPIAFRLTHQKKLKYIFTGYSALEKEWNGKYPAYLNNKHPNQQELNAYLIKEYAKANDQLIKLQQQEKPFTVYNIHSKIKQQSSSTSLFTFTNELIEKLLKSGRIGNAVNYKNTLRVIKLFTKDKDLKFEEINYKWLSDFEAYHYSKGNSPVSLSVYMRALKAIYGFNAFILKMRQFNPTRHFLYLSYLYEENNNSSNYLTF